MRIIILLFFLTALSSCGSKYIQEVSAAQKTKFGFEITAPNQAIYFVTNEKIEFRNITKNNPEKIANVLYNKYGPARDDFFIGSTNAIDFKFNLENKTYYIAIDKFRKRNAMLLFDGKHKPKIEFNPKKYNQLIIKSKH